MERCPRKAMRALIDRLRAGELPGKSELENLIARRTPEIERYAAGQALEVREAVYGRDVFIRGLIEFTSHCKNDCLYCGLRASNRQCARYRLTEREILDCCAAGYALGFRTFVLQGGEDGYFTDGRLCALVRAVKTAHPDCALTLSVGERSAASYRLLRQAGAERYLLRHETADPAHYAALHPAAQRFEARMECLKALKNEGFCVGAGFMVGSPGQSAACLARDLEFLYHFKPQMAGIGPFIPHHATPFANCPPGTLRDTLFMLSLTRLILPRALLPATTALSTIHPQGREMGMLCGANVVMPNLSPGNVRGKYLLYDGKLASGAEAAESLDELKSRMSAAGFRVVVDRGDPR